MNASSNPSETPSAPQGPAAQQPAAAPAQAPGAPAPGATGPRPGGYGPRPGGGRPFVRRPGGPGGPGGGGDRRPGGRRFFARRKVCAFCVDHAKAIDYKDVGKLRRFISDRGKIEPRRKTGNCAKHQRLLAVALKRARHLALLPYTPEHIHGLSVAGMA